MSKICPFLGAEKFCRYQDCSLWVGAEAGECSFKSLATSARRLEPQAKPDVKIKILNSALGDEMKMAAASAIRDELKKAGEQDTAAFLRAQSPASPKKSFTPDERTRSGTGLNSVGLPPSEVEAWMEAAAKNRG